MTPKLPGAHGSLQGLKRPWIYYYSDAFYTRLLLVCFPVKCIRRDCGNRPTSVCPKRHGYVANSKGCRGDNMTYLQTAVKCTITICRGQAAAVT